jgi:ligand-binding sensor domain-containing protein/two-component sensor histidine kinase
MLLLKIVAKFKPMLRGKTILVLIFLFISFSLASQQVIFKTYTVYDGLVANPVRCIYQDSKGFIWIGTYEGLSRYDGYKFMNYTNTNGLSHNLINSIIEKNGKLLIAENNGAVDVIENNSLQKRFMLGSGVNAVMHYKDRLLFTTDGNGFYEYKNDTIISPVQEKTSTLLGHFLALDDSLLLSDGVDNSLIIYKKDLSVRLWVKNPGAHFYNLVRDSKQRIWACTSAGLKLLQITTGKKLSASYTLLPDAFNFSPLNNAQVTSMIEEKDGSYWIGTLKGLVHLLPDGSFHVYNEKEGLPSAIINTLYRDKETNLWIGTALGLAKWVSKNNVVFYSTENKEFRNDIISIYNLNDKKIILEADHGVQQFDIDTKEFKDIKRTGSDHPVPVQGTSPLLVHYADKIGFFDSTKNIIIPVRKLDTAIRGVIVSAMHPDGTIFLGTFGGLFAVKKNSIVKILSHRITCMAIDNNGNVWAGTWINGIFRITIKDNRDATYDVQDITSVIKEKSIRGLYADSKKNIWVGTRYAGAFCLTEKTNNKFDVRHFNRQSGLMSDWVSSFAETNEDDMWIGSYLGLDKLVKESPGYRVFNFSKTVNFFAEVKKIISLGNHAWVCVANTGIAYFKDESLHQIPPLQASILSASLGVLENKLTILSPIEKISLKPNQNTARFEFSALEFINERQILYSYRLKGSRDTTWTKPENIHEAIYASLSSGNYSFEVKTIGWNGQDSAPVSFSFFIATPFWKQWWFISLGILAIAIFFYALYRYRIRQLLRLQNVRNSIATDLHDDIGSTLTNISVLSELTDKTLEQPAKARQYLERITEEVNASGQALDDIIWSVNTNNDTLDEMVARMRRFASEIFDHTTTQYHFMLEEGSAQKKIDMEHRKDIYLVYKEAINNIYKHASAQHVFIRLSLANQFLEMEIKDDGKGFDPNSDTHRNGLKNLKTRVGKWKGIIKVESGRNEGTMIQIKIPVKWGLPK